MVVRWIRQKFKGAKKEEEKMDKNGTWNLAAERRSSILFFYLKKIPHHDENACTTTLAVATKTQMHR